LKRFDPLLTRLKHFTISDRPTPDESIPNVDIAWNGSIFVWMVKSVLLVVSCVQIAVLELDRSNLLSEKAATDKELMDAKNLLALGRVEKDDLLKQLDCEKVRYFEM
jgi:hypothetical protein